MRGPVGPDRDRRAQPSLPLLIGFSAVVLALARTRRPWGAAPAGQDTPVAAAVLVPQAMSSGAPPDVEPQPTKDEDEPPLVRWARLVNVQRLVLALTAGGAATYGATYLAAVGYLRRFGVTPDEVSMSYASVLPRAVAGLLVPLASAAAVLTAVASVTHWRLVVANRRAALAGRAVVADETVVSFDLAGGLLLPVVWLLGTLAFVAGLQRTHLPATAVWVTLAWVGIVLLPLLPVALAQAAITRAALRTAARAARRRPRKQGRAPTLGGTVGVLLVLFALVVVPVLAGGYVQGSRAGGRLAESGDLRPQRVDYGLLPSWTSALVLPQVTCVRAVWTAGPPPAEVPVGPVVHLGTSEDLAVLYDVRDGRTVRIYVGSVVLVSLPDGDCRRP